MTETLQYLKKHGQRLDLEIAREMRVPLAIVRQQLTALSERREAIVCKTIQFENGKTLSANASAELDVSGDSGMLVARGLPAPGSGRVYQVWVQRDGGPPEWLDTTPRYW